MTITNDTKIVVTGGAGFIGKSLIIKLLEINKFKIFNIDKISYSSDLIALDKWFKKNNNTQSDNYKFIKTDLINKEEINYLIQSIKPDFIFHLAAETHVDSLLILQEFFLKVM